MGFFFESAGSIRAGKCEAGSSSEVKKGNGKGGRVSVEKSISGAWRVSDIIGGRLISRAYYGHSKREAVRAFVRENGKGAA